MVKRKIIVLGRGRSAVAAMSLADSLGYEALSVEGDDSLPPKSFDFAVASPGIAPDHRWFASLSERNIEVISELQFGLSVLKRKGWRILAVTGSKGKSSVVKVIADAKERGLDAIADKIRDTYKLEKSEDAVKIENDGNTLTVTVDYCPAVRHLRSTGREVCPWFSLSTETVMQTLADKTNLDFAMLSYDEETGAAEYRFTKRG
jgi:hypothetical protein